MAWRDLHDGVAELFSELAEGVIHRVEETLEARRAWRIARERDRGSRYQRRQAAVLPLRRPPVWSPERPAVGLACCIRCHLDVEHREGCPGPVGHRCRERRRSLQREAA